MAPFAYLSAHNFGGDFLARPMTQRSHDLDLFVANAVRAEVRRRLHRHKTEKLQQMILHHIAQRTCAFVISGASPYAERLRRGDLHLIDIVRVPKGREDRVGEAQDKNVLRGFFPEKVVDPVGLFFAEGIVDDAIEFAGRGEIGAERLFDDYSRPASLQRLVQASGFEVLKNRLELIGSSGEIKSRLPRVPRFLSISSRCLAR